jgi:hypothetical protein
LLKIRREAESLQKQKNDQSHAKVIKLQMELSALAKTSRIGQSESADRLEEQRQAYEAKILDMDCEMKRLERECIFLTETKKTKKAPTQAFISPSKSDVGPRAQSPAKDFVEFKTEVNDFITKNVIRSPHPGNSKQFECDNSAKKLSSFNYEPAPSDYHKVKRVSEKKTLANGDVYEGEFNA